MDQTALYDEDIYAWSQHQARVLRGLAGSGLRLHNDLDLEHVAEEIEDVGNEQRFRVESNLIRVFVHLIKLVALPGDQAGRHWTKGANAFLATAARRWRPSMRRAVDPDALWSDDRRQATRDLEIDGFAVAPLPQGCPFGLEVLVEGETDPRDLVARLAGAVAAGGHMPEA